MTTFFAIVKGCDGETFTLYKVEILCFYAIFYPCMLFYPPTKILTTKIYDEH